MQFTTAIVALFGASLVAAAPLEQRQLPVCSGLTTTPQCCDVDVLGVADLNCENPLSTPTDRETFTTICADVGKIASCCLLPIVCLHSPFIKE